MNTSAILSKLILLFIFLSNFITIIVLIYNTIFNISSLDITLRILIVLVLVNFLDKIEFKFRKIKSK